MSTQKAFSVTLTKPGVRDYGVWAGKTGGESTRDVTDYYPGAQRPAIKYTDTPTTSDIVIRKREADLTDAAVRELYADLDSDAEYICVVQRMTAGNGNAGAPRSYRGLVVGVTPSDVDAGSADVAEMQVTLAVFGLPTIAS
jgi:hypothetical protein